MIAARMVRRLSNRNCIPRGWLLYTAAVVCGAAAAGLSNIWLPSPFAASIGVAVVAASGRMADQLLPKIAQAATLRASWPEHLLNVRNQGLPRVEDFSDPTALGVHPAGPPSRSHDPEGQPPYIERDSDKSLREHLIRGGFILLIGESTAGKTRSAYEAIQAVLQDFFLVRPLTRASIPAALQAVQAHKRCVVWLDDLENYLGPDGLTEAAVRRMISEPERATILVATMRTEEHRRYNAREGSRLTGADRDLWRAERSVVHLAAPIRIERCWTPDECARGQAHASDPRIASALTACDRFGLAEILAAGPELLDAWRDAWSPGANPRGAALVNAAVDCRAMGLRRHLPISWLAELHQPYLEARGGARLQPESFEDALAWTCQPTHATSSLLIGDATRGYTVFDYLLDSSQQTTIPDHLWNFTFPRITALEAYNIGLTAHRASRFAHAEEALQKAADEGIPGAYFALAVTLGDAGKQSAAVSALQGILNRLQDAHGTPPSEIFAVRHQISYFIGESGNQAEAASQFNILARDTEDVFGPDHDDTLSARRQHAHFTGEAGDYADAVRLLQPLLADYVRLLGHDHPHTLATRRSIAWFTGLGGNVPAATTQLSELLRDASLALGEDEPHVLAIRGALAHFTGRAGRPGEAVQLLDSLRRDRERLLGALHPHTLVTRQQLALFTAQAGLRSEAITQLEQVVADMDQVLDAAHTHRRSAENALDRLKNGGPVWPQGGGWA
ncbi:hypothetical protein M2164_008070 [Streptomyces sp. SAI-208]|nr:hypothetical protein [Streptomyces sp. SAI-208]